MIGTMTVKSRVSEMDLDVTVDGLVITVSGGDVVVGGVSGNVSSVDHTVTPDASHKMTVAGFLVQAVDDGSLDVLVDEFVPGAGESRYDFAVEGPYKLLDRIFHVSVPSGAVTLNDLTVTTWKIEKVVSDPSVSRLSRLMVKEEGEKKPKQPVSDVDLLLDPGAQALISGGGE